MLTGLWFVFGVEIRFWSRSFAESEGNTRNSKSAQRDWNRAASRRCEVKCPVIKQNSWCDPWYSVQHTPVNLFCKFVPMICEQLLDKRSSLVKETCGKSILCLFLFGSFWSQWKGTITACIQNIGKASDSYPSVLLSSLLQLTYVTVSSCAQLKSTVLSKLKYWRSKWSRRLHGIVFIP